MKLFLEKPQITIAVILVFSVLFQVFMPIFGDEAYFVSWGHNPSFGYYDHPPSIGWLSIPIIWLEQAIGLQPHGILHRIFILILTILTILYLRVALKNRFPLLNIDTLLLAFSALPVFIVVSNSFFNDTILAIFLLLFFLNTEKSFREPKFTWRPIILAGLFFGFALQTKYSVGIFYLGTVLFLLSTKHGRRFLFGRFVIISVIAGMIFLPNIYWNLHNCSINFAFNFSFREVTPSFRGALELSLVLLLTLGPALIIFFKFRYSKIGFFTGVFIGVLLVSFLYAISRGTFRLNWGTPFIFMGVIAAAEMLNNQEINWLKKWNFRFLLVSFVPILGILILDAFGFRPLERFLDQQSLIQFNLEADLADGSLPKALRLISDDRIVATDLYMQTAVLENHGFASATVIGGSIFGRNHDIFTDYASLDGRDILLISQDYEKAGAMAAQIFDSFEWLELKGTRQSHRIILGHNFSFDNYWNLVMSPFVDSYYAQSPFPSVGCYLKK